MSFNFLCPQGHWLSGDESQMGQQLQCPVCGSLFIVPVVQPSIPMGWLPGQFPQQPQAAVPYWPPGGLQGTVPGPDTTGAASGVPGHVPSWPPAAQPGQLPFVPATAPAGGEPLTEAPVIRTSPEPVSPATSLTFAAPAAEVAGTVEAGSAAHTSLAAHAGPDAHVGAGTAGAAGSQPAQPEGTAAQAPAKKEPRILHIPCPKGHELPTPEEMLDQEALCPYCRTQFRLLYKNSVEYKQEKARAEQERQARINRLAVKLSVWGAVLVLLFVIVLVVLHYAK